ncbi:Copine-2 [Balamuthia mandrillaris]
MQGLGTAATGGAAPRMQVELSLACRKLRKMDLLSQSDPMILVQKFESGRWVEVGKTEHLHNQKDPVFQTKFVLDYYFERVQKLRFMVYDVDDKKRVELERQDFIGEAECTLGDVIGATGQRHSIPLQNVNVKSKKKAGWLIVSGEQRSSAASRFTVRLHFRGSKLDKKDVFGKSDPYLEIYKANQQQGNETFTLVHKTETIKKTLDPVWAPFEISSTTLCGDDWNRPLLLKVYDWDKTGSNDLIGICRTTLAEMERGKDMFELIEPELKKKKKKYTNSGFLHVVSCTTKRHFNFLDYVAGGCEISLAIAIDFTASNGKPDDPKSLHYKNPSGEPNQYVKAILSVGDIIAAYDHDKKFPVYGFGAKIPPTSTVSHCFHVNFDPSNPECVGIDNVVGAYYHALQNVTLYGPTNFAPIINKVASMAADSRSHGQKYWVLLIITDGIISDMEDTIKEIVDASSLPLSIVIVGVGNEDFRNMDHLDSDDHLLRSGKSNKTAQRDIVQFVPFLKFVNRHYSELAAEVLAEIPSQLVQYMEANNIQPQPKPQMPMTQMIPPSTGAPYFSQAGPSGPPMSHYPPSQQGGYPQQGGYYPPQQQGGYPPSSQYPPQQGGYPPQQGGYPPPSSQYPPQQGGYPPQQQGGYPQQQQQGGAPPTQQAPPSTQQQQGSSVAKDGGQQQGGAAPSSTQQAPPSTQQQGGYPQQGGYYPPQQGGYYPPQQGGYYPPQQGGYYPPPQQGGYPPQQGGYPPQQGGYPPQQGGYPPQQGGYPQQQQQQQKPAEGGK